MHLNLRRLVAPVCFVFLAAASLTAAPLTASLGFTGGPVGVWSVDFASGPAVVELLEMSITLPSTFAFDTQSGGFGSLLSQDFSKISGSATMTGMTPNTQASRDGSNVITLGFSGFTTATSPYNFSLDVDGTAILGTPRNCSGLTGLAKIGCQFYNSVTLPAANAAAHTAASWVTADQISGTLVSFKFGATGYTPVVLSTTLGNLGAIGNVSAGGEFSGEIIPEPGTYAMLGAGLLALVALRKRRKQ